MKVKALRPHQNEYPPSFDKAKGDIYEVPDEDGRALIANEIVEKVGDDKPEK